MTGNGTTPTADWTTVTGNGTPPTADWTTATGNWTTPTADWTTVTGNWTTPTADWTTTTYQRSACGYEVSIRELAFGPLTQAPNTYEGGGATVAPLLVKAPAALQAAGPWRALIR